MSFKDQLREVLEDYSDKYSTGLQLSNIVKLDKATDQAIASIVELVEQEVVKGRLIELDLLEQALNRGDDLMVYKIYRLEELTSKLTQEDRE